MQTGIAKPDQHLLQNIWHEDVYRLELCEAKSGGHTVLTQVVKKHSELLFTMASV
jgi:hypothetical protein